MQTRYRSGVYRELSARLTADKPSLSAGEIAVKLNIEVPAALFSQPQLKASIVIPESSVSPPVIDAAVFDNVREVLQQTTGMKIELSLVDTKTSAEFEAYQKSLESDEDGE